MCTSSARSIPPPVGRAVLFSGLRMVTLSPVDIFLILSYFAAVLFVGFRSARTTTASAADYLLGGRSLTLPVFVMTLVSTWYGGILGVGEFTYRYGISNWVVQGIPYYVFAAVFAVFLAKKIRSTNLYSIPDKLHDAYDRKTAILGAILTFILMSPAPYVLMLAVLLNILFGWNMVASVVVIAVVALSYMYAGGFRSDVATDILEFVLMFAGFMVIIPFAIHHYGGMEFLERHLPAPHLLWNGGHSAQYLLVWFFIALWTFVDPAFHQRCYAAKDARTAQRGILVSILFWFLFDSMTLTAGLYARAALPDLSQPMMSYPLLAEAVLPPVAKGLFYIGLLATIMSTLNTLGFVSAQTLGRDIILRAKRADLRADQNSPLAVRYTKIGLIAAFILSVILDFLLPSVVEMWYTIGTVVIPGLLVPVIAGYFPKLHIASRYAFFSMLFGWTTSSCWLIAGHFGNHYPLGIEPMYPGLLVSLIFWIVGKIRR